MRVWRLEVRHDAANSYEQTIDADWFNQCFQAIGIDAEVRDFTAQRVGTGQIGKCIRYTFDYVAASADAPSSLVGKFPSDDPSSRATVCVAKLP